MQRKDHMRTVMIGDALVIALSAAQHHVIYSAIVRPESNGPQLNGKKGKQKKYPRR